jgi:hypothetical protein
MWIRVGINWLHITCETPMSMFTWQIWVVGMGEDGGGGMPQFGRDGINTNDEWEFAWGSWEAERSGYYTFVNQFLRNHDTPEDRAKNNFKRKAANYGISLKSSFSQTYNYDDDLKTRYYVNQETGEISGLIPEIDINCTVKWALVANSMGATNGGGFNQVSSTADGNYGPYLEGYRYGNSLADIVTSVGSAARIYKNLPAKMVPIIAKHYGDVNFKFGTPIGRIGTIGDAISTFGAVNNLINTPSSVEYWTDAVFTGFGWVPVYGDFTALLYSGAKDQIQTIQGNVNNNRNPLQGTYVPGTGDFWFGY